MKKSRIIVDVSPDLLAWVHAMASAEEATDGQWVRAQLARMRLGGQQFVFEAQPQQTAPEAPYAAPEPIQGEPDIDAMVNGALGQAEQQGLTEPIEREPIPESGVRSIRRPPAPYSPATQPKYLEGR